MRDETAVTASAPQSESGALFDAGALMRRASLYSLLVGLFLVSLKAFAWSLTDAVSLMSSLADSLLDVMASAVNFGAIRYALQPADHEHRFGHGKAEDLATLAQSTFICGSGVFLVAASVARLTHPVALAQGWVGIAVMTVSIVCSLWLTRYEKRVAAKTGSSAIAADALHYFTDLLSNIGVLLALIAAQWLGWEWADPICALLVACYMLKGAYEMIRKALKHLMDHEFSDEEREEIKRIVRAHPETMGLHELRTRRSGINSFIQFHLDLDGSMTLLRAHEISDKVEATLRIAFPNAEILIHQDPRMSGQ